MLTPDLPVAYRDLLPPSSTPRRLADLVHRRVDKLTYSPSCFLLLAGSKQKYSQIGHHNIHFGRAWKRTFREIIDRGELMSDPSILVTNPTHSDPELAPDGKHIYYVLFPTPNLDAPIDWDVVGPRYRDEAVATLERRGYIGFGDGIEVEEITTPADWRARGMERGAPVRGGALLPADRPVPAVEPRRGLRERRVRRLRAPSPAWGCRWCCSRVGSPPNASSGRTGTTAAAPGPPETPAPGPRLSANLQLLLTDSGP